MNLNDGFSDVVFIFIEFVYLFLIVLYLFTNLKFLPWIAYGVAGLKFSISAIYSFDMINYQKIYADVKEISLEPFQNIEGGYASLIYIFKSLNLPLGVLHGLEIVGFLLACRFLFKAFLPEDKATVLALCLGFFSTSGELGAYLLRQLLSTSLVFVGLGFIFRGRNLPAFLFYGLSFLFHSSSFIFIPLFIACLFPNKLVKALIFVGGYLVLFIVASNVEISSSALIFFTGKESLYVSKQKEYIQTIGKEGWREFRAGLFSILLFLYFVFLNIRFQGLLWRSSNWIYYTFSVALTVFYLALEQLKLFWLSSRFNFISDILILSSCILMTLEVINPRDQRPFLMAILMGCFCISLLNILVGYDNNILFRLPLS
ncbi:MAG: EpsG family protein [Cyanobacteriota bacterium]|nr:EpsG family protein [Cyanobacteriota bacterium]